MIRKLMLVALLAVFGINAEAGSARKGLLLSNYDLDATDPTYCYYTGVQGSPFGGALAGGAPVSTSGSSTTVAATTASTAPFAGVNVGAILYIYSSGPQTVPVVRHVTAKASNDSITVSSAITLTAASFTYRNRTCGTGAGDGWVDVSTAEEVRFSWRITQADATGGIAVTVRCKDNDDAGVGNQVYPPNNTGGTRECEDTGIFLTTTTGCAVVIYEGWDSCRLGVEIVTADDGSDTTTHTEQIYATVRVK